MENDYLHIIPSELYFVNFSYNVMKLKNNECKLINLKIPIGQVIKSLSDYCK